MLHRNHTIEIFLSFYVHL